MNLDGICKLEFRSSERRRGNSWLWAINISPLRGGNQCLVTWFTFKGPKNSRKKKRTNELVSQRLKVIPTEF